MGPFRQQLGGARRGHQRQLGLRDDAVEVTQASGGPQLQRMRPEAAPTDQVSAPQDSLVNGLSKLCSAGASGRCGLMLELFPSG